MNDRNNQIINYFVTPTQSNKTLKYFRKNVHIIFFRLEHIMLSYFRDKEKKRKKELLHQSNNQIMKSKKAINNYQLITNMKHKHLMLS